MAEIYNALTSDMLTENPEVAQSNLGLGRKVVHCYKGMTEEERRKVREEQLEQIEEAKVRIFQKLYFIFFNHHLQLPQI